MTRSIPYAQLQPERQPQARIVAVADFGCYPRRPDGKPYVTEIRDDGSIWRNGVRRGVDLTAEEMRQLQAQLEFGAEGINMIDWLFPAWKMGRKA